MKRPAPKRERAKTYLLLSLSDGKKRPRADLINARPADLSVTTLWKAREELIAQHKLVEEWSDQRGILVFRPGANTARVLPGINRAMAVSDQREEMRFERRQARQRRMEDQAFRRKLERRKREKAEEKARLDAARAAVEAVEKSAEG